MEVKIYGAFRSGTNYVKALLELNHEVWVRSWNGVSNLLVEDLLDELGYSAGVKP